METMDINARKYKLISKVMHIENEFNVQLIENFFEKITHKSNYQEESINKIVKPMRKNISISDIKIEQKYHGIDFDSFNKLIEEINVQEPLTELLNIN
ncbi:MAG: hypothetical protein DRJ05_14385 [Bacteroidetes bacterium]|nr:MAG: hypothetical protein DRJ05_14385 [Bacteroidota bacterium]